MKMNKAHMYVAIIQSVLATSNMKHLAKEVMCRLNKSDKDCVEIQDTKTHGFSLRRKKDSEISDALIGDAIIDATNTIIDDNSDEVLDYISDNYEFTLDYDCIDESFVENIFEITRSGRIIYVEVDS